MKKKESIELQRAFVKPFKTIDNYYVYDVGTNRIFKVDEVIFSIIEKVGLISNEDIFSQFRDRFGLETIYKSLKEIQNAQEKGFFINGYPSITSLGFNKKVLKEKMNHELSQMILEVSQDCNLDCHYCTFSGCYEGHRLHNKKFMTADIMKKAVDFLYSHSSKNKDVTLSFYGGEPLLNFKVIEGSVKYADSLFKDRRCNFSMTTNAILINKERANFFARHEFKITVSLDGPKEIHDSHRVDKNGQGCYKRATRGMKLLVEAYKEELLPYLAINMVITPPHTLAEINRLWEREPWLPKSILVMADYVDETGSTFFDKYPVEKGKQKESLKNNKRFTKDYFIECFLNNQSKSPLGKALYDKGLARINKRPVFTVPEKKCHLNGCCVPGVRKIFVDSGGSLKICERIHGAPNIGDIHSDYDYEKIFRIIDKYKRDCRHSCFSCWAIRFCGLCFVHAFASGKYDKTLKASHCEPERRDIESRLALYYYLLEKDPHCLDFLEDYEFE